MSVTIKGDYFRLDTLNTTYIFKTTNGYPEHIYYGKKLAEGDYPMLSNPQIYGFSPYQKETKVHILPDVRLLEYSGFNSGDFRTPACKTRDFKGFFGNRFLYKAHEISVNPPDFGALPGCRCLGGEKTLTLTLADMDKNIEIDLYYTLFEEIDVIARAAKIKNLSGGSIFIEKLASAQVDFFSCDFDLYELSGVPGNEHLLSKSAIKQGVNLIKSTKGFTSHTTNPFFMLASKTADEYFGEVYGFNLLYSGNFACEIEVDRLSQTRAVIGINEETFDWELKAGDEFITPQAVMSFSDGGLNSLSQNFHSLTLSRIIPDNFKKRPILVNTWEAYHFDIDCQKIDALAKKAKQLGMEMVVIDDGWFRNSDNENLGDWTADSKKFPQGIKLAVDKIKQCGLLAGLWFEPEMVSDNSRLFKEKGDWVLNNGNSPAYSRSQLVLDMGNAEVIDYLFDKISAFVEDCSLDYLKWDANRYISEAGSKCAARQGEVLHRYILGLYTLLGRLNKKFPQLLIESCAGGGGRFDLGMLYFTPQIWVSDDTEPCGRIKKQYSLSYGYPAAVMSCHLTRNTGYGKDERSFDFRYMASNFGVFGYELDILNLTGEEEELIKSYNREYKNIRDLALCGDLYRIISPINCGWAAYTQVSKDKKAAIACFLQLEPVNNSETVILRLKGLNESYNYRIKGTDTVYSGALLTNAGIRINNLISRHWEEDFDGQLTFTRGGNGAGIQFILEAV